MAEDWSAHEVELIIKDYFDMLIQERKGLPYSKAEHSRALMPRLNNRSKQSIEFKHANISAVLDENGQPYILGYKPRGNYQKLLEDHVLRYLDRHSDTLDPLFEAFVEEALPEKADAQPDFTHCEEPAPEYATPKKKEIQFRAVKINYLEREQRNRVLGAAGEKFVIDFEKWRLEEAGRADLIPSIRWVSKEKGDGLGYDILSKNDDGSDRFIEVKTTKLAKETPIYLTVTEIAFAADHAASFYLYRVFDFAGKKKLFIRQGRYGDFCQLTPVSYKGSF